jgi:trans-aconitate methyltransferase
MSNHESAENSQWNAALYENKHAFIWKHGASLLDILSPQRGERILDLGCGTGHLTNKIADAGTVVIGIDNALTMIAQARKNYPSLQFIVADGANFYFDEPFDAVFSNAALHWMKEPEPVIKCIWQVLKPGGRFVAEFGGRGNVQTIVTAINTAIEASGYPVKGELNPWYFPSIGEYAMLLEQQGFCVTYSVLFNRQTPLDGNEQGIHNWIQMFGNSFLSVISPDKHSDVIRKIEDKLRSKLYQDGIWFADYRRIRVNAEKEL